MAAGNGIKSATVRPPPSRGSSRKKLCTWQLLMPRRKILSYPAFPVLLPRLLSLFQRFPPRTFFTHTCISLDNNDSPALNFTRRGVHGSRWISIPSTDKRNIFSLLFFRYHRFLEEKARNKVKKKRLVIRVRASIALRKTRSLGESLSFPRKRKKNLPGGSVDATMDVARVSSRWEDSRAVIR